LDFLGLEQLLHMKKQIIGLTSAATIWSVAILGIGVGLGQFILSLFFTALIYFVLIEPRVETRLRRR